MVQEDRGGGLLALLAVGLVGVAAMVVALVTYRPALPEPVVAKLAPSVESQLTALLDGASRNLERVMVATADIEVPQRSAGAELRPEPAWEGLPVESPEAWRRVMDGGAFIGEPPDVTADTSLVPVEHLLFRSAEFHPRDEEIDPERRRAFVESLGPAFASSREIHRARTDAARIESEHLIVVMEAGLTERPDLTETFFTIDTGAGRRYATLDQMPSTKQAQEMRNISKMHSMMLVVDWFQQASCLTHAEAADLRTRILDLLAN